MSDQHDFRLPVEPEAPDRSTTKWFGDRKNRWILCYNFSFHRDRFIMLRHENSALLVGNSSFEEVRLRRFDFPFFHAIALNLLSV